MKKFSLITTLIAPLILLSGCEKEKVTDEADAVKIQFSAEDTSSRAAIGSEGFPKGSAFSVWGYMTKEFQTATVFDGSTVTKEADDNWNCNDIRYWFPGWTYNFYGVYPVNASNNVSVSQSGEIKIENFDCSATGADAKDLMTGATIGCSYTIGTEPKSVSITFSHLLAKVDFVGKCQGGNASVSSIKIDNIYTLGTYTSSSETTPWTLSQNTNSISISHEQPVALNTEGLSVSGDLLIIPQTLTNTNIILTVTYNTETETDKTAIYNLPVDVITEWAAGKSYSYSFTVTGGGYIVFDPPTVNNWNNAIGGDVNIDVTQ